MSLSPHLRAHHNRAVRWCQDNQCNAMTPTQTRSLGITVNALGKLLDAGIWQVIELPPTYQLVHHITDPRLGADPS